MLYTPVAFFIFNRPETTEKVFTQISRVKPRKLLVVADGARSEAEISRCAAARAIIGRLDWDCELLTNYSNVNLGCKERVSSGLSWVFDQCEEVIILEDDCLPHPTFFRFCSDLLEKYRSDNRVMAIGGTNFQNGALRGEGSYYFSQYAQIWGWASWRRAWKKYDLQMRRWPSLRETTWLEHTLSYDKAARHWREKFNYNYEGLLDSWDMQWIFACLVNNGLTALPNRNLISNIGFGDGATHTKSDIYGLAELSRFEMAFPLKHPLSVVPDIEADRFMFDHVIAKEVEQVSRYRRLGRRIFALLPDNLKNSIKEMQTRLG